MAPPNRRESSGLIDELFRNGHRFDFFQAVRVLEFWHRERAQARPESIAPLEPCGRDSFDREIAWFRALPSLSFAQTPVAKIQSPANAPGRTEARSDLDKDSLVSLAPPNAAEVLVTFFGLTGPSGVLPLHYTELLLQRNREKDTTSRDFFDLFNHRLISLFYRVWEKNRLVIGYERSCFDPSGNSDLITRGLFSLVGMGTGGLRRKLKLNDEIFLHYSGHFAHYPRSAIALESLLTDYLDMSAKVLQLQGQWLRLETDSLSITPRRGQLAGQNNQLGVNLVLGDRVWDIRSKIRIRLGPLDWRNFRSLMPDSDGLVRLCQLVRSYVGPDLDFDIQPVLEAPEVPWCQLAANPAQGSFLGWNSWIRSADFTSPVNDAVFSLGRI